LASVSSPKVAVVVVNWNSGDLLRQCLSALTSQTKTSDSIVVVDNASSDGSIAAVENRYPQVKIVRLDRNTGFAAANNRAISGLNDVTWVALVNPDAFPEPKWLETILDAARSYPDYTFYASRMMSNANRAVLDGTGDVYHTSGAAWRRGYGREYQIRDLQKGEVFGACAGAALYCRDAFVGAGGLDEKYFCYFEDVDLSFRLRLAGHRCLYVPDAVVYHVGSATIGGERSDFTTYHGQRNLVWTFFKNMPLPLLWLYLPQHILLNLAMLVWYSLRGQARAIWKAKWDAIMGLPRILKERRRIQKTRRVNVWQLRQVMARGLLTPYLRRRE
jgi:GT2 family glycosyltransferase